jgi:hypothetical protein
MSQINKEINQYWVHFQSGKTERNKISPRAIIKCYHDDDFLVQLNFYSEKRTLPVNYHDEKFGLVYLRYPISMYANILDILRNEKPIYFSYSPKTNLGFIRTGKEPVGEGEEDL